MKQKMLTVRESIVWIISSIVVVVFLTTVASVYYFHLHEVQLHDEKFMIAKIRTRAVGEREIPIHHFIGWLGLSSDQNHLIAFDPEKAIETLLKTGLFSSVKVGKEYPSTLLVTYTLREPRFLLKEESNIAMDAEGAKFPLHPYHEKRELPLLYGESDFGLAQELYQVIEESEKLDVRLISAIDLANMQQEGVARRFVIVVYDSRWIVRLSPHDFEEQMERLAALREQSEQNRFDSEEGNVFVDLRIPELAYIKR